MHEGKLMRGAVALGYFRIQFQQATGKNVDSWKSHMFEIEKATEYSHLNCRQWSEKMLTHFCRTGLEGQLKNKYSFAYPFLHYMT